jgi:hypothetical protein
MEPSLDTWITIQDETKKFNIPYFSYRICCNQKINGELSLLRSILKNTPNAVIFDVGATGSQIPNDIDSNTSVHLFDPAFKPSGDAFIGDSTYVMYKEHVDYDKPNVHVNTYGLNDTDKTIVEYCKDRDITHIDFLKIDTDGHDLSVLNGLGDIDVDMIQFEYDNFYRKEGLDINDMFKKLKGWYFFYILPSGLLPIDKMRDDYIYTNIFASKVYPEVIISDYVPLLIDTTVKVNRVGEFMCEMFWEMQDVTPNMFAIKYCIPIKHEDTINEQWNLENALRHYHGLYSV